MIPSFQKNYEEIIKIKQALYKFTFIIESFQVSHFFSTFFVLVIVALTWAPVTAFGSVLTVFAVFLTYVTAGLTYLVAVYAAFEFFL